MNKTMLFAQEKNFLSQTINSRREKKAIELKTKKHSMDIQLDENDVSKIIANTMKCKVQKKWKWKYIGVTFREKNCKKKEIKLSGEKILMWNEKWLKPPQVGGYYYMDRCCNSFISISLKSLN